MHNNTVDSYNIYINIFLRNVIKGNTSQCGQKLFQKISMNDNFHMKKYFLEEIKTRRTYLLS